MRAPFWMKVSHRNVEGRFVVTVSTRRWALPFILWASRREILRVIRDRLDN